MSGGDKITVTCTDHETGDTETQELVDYVFVASDKVTVGEQRFANGTVVLTIKPAANLQSETEQG